MFVAAVSGSILDYGSSANTGAAAGNENLNNAIAALKTDSKLDLSAVVPVSEGDEDPLIITEVCTRKH